jgi:hypothetical protein
LPRSLVGVTRREGLGSGASGASEGRKGARWNKEPGVRRSDEKRQVGRVRRGVDNAAKTGKEGD